MVVSPSLVGMAYFALGLGLLVLLLDSIRQPDRPEGPWLALTITAFALWLLSLGINYQLTDVDASMIAWNGRYIAATAMSVGWILLAVAYTTRQRPSTVLLGLLGGYLVVDVTVVATNGWHDLVLAGDTGMIGPVPDPSYGSWFWLHTGVNYLMVFGATVVFAFVWAGSSDLRRKQSALLTAGAVPPVLANMVTLTGLVDVPYDLTPIGLAVTGLMLTYAIYRMELLDVVPIARATAVEEMRDAVVTVDADGRVVDANDAARTLFDAEAGYVGAPAADFFTPINDDIETQLEAESDVDTRVTATIDGEDRHFSLSISPVGTGGTAGRVVVLRDVTPIIRRERALEERESELDLLRQVLTRVLTHNVRNALTTIHGNAELLADSVDAPAAERADTILETSDDLLDISEKVKHVEQILDDQEPIPYDLVTLVEDVVADLRVEYPAVDFSIEAPAECPVESTPGLDAAVLALLENAAEYNDPVEARVEVTIDPDGPTLSVSDRGPGIPPEEVDVLKAERETALEHGSGLGLWLVKWVADHSGADLSFSRSPHGTTATLAFGGSEPDHLELLE